MPVFEEITTLPSGVMKVGDDLFEEGEQMTVRMGDGSFGIVRQLVEHRPTPPPPPDDEEEDEIRLLQERLERLRAAKRSKMMESVFRGAGSAPTPIPKAAYEPWSVYGAAAGVKPPSASDVPVDDPPAVAHAASDVPVDGPPSVAHAASDVPVDAWAGWRSAWRRD